MANKKTPLYKKRRTDRKIKNSDGITRVKPVRNIGKDEDGRQIQNIVIKRADGSIHTDRYADGEKVGSTYQPKKMKMKKVRKIRKKRMPKPKKVKVPEDIANYKSPGVTLDEDAVKEVKRRERVAERKKPKNKIKRVVKRATNKIKDAATTTGRKIKRKLTRGPKGRKVKNLVTGKFNKLR